MLALTLLASIGALAQDVVVIQRVTVSGNQRIEPETIASYLTVKLGDPFDSQKLDDSLKALFATGLFADVRLVQQGSTLSIVVVENPIINRIVFEGNRKLDNDELRDEVQLKPRIVYTRAKVRADVQRILELYRRSGRFAAVVEPKIIQLPQNRVNLVFEINEGPKTKVGRIRFLGNERYKDGRLRDEIATREARWWRLFTSDDTYDPDRLAFDREQLRQFYLQNGYADFRIISAVAELTPDREQFFITFTLEEGETYNFGTVELESDIRDIDPVIFRNFLLMKEGQRYNAKLIEDTIEVLTNAAGLLGYAFLDIRPRVRRDRAERTINITFRILEAPRTYIERIDIHGNVRTLDRIIRREFRLVEGDAFNSSRLNRSEQRINALGFFREVEIEQIPGTQPDRVILDVAVQEQATGELSIGAGFSSVDNFIIDVSIRERNLLGKGQDLRLGVTFSSRRQQIDLGFTEPYFLNRQIAAGFDLFLREIDSITESSFRQRSFGGALRAGLPLTEYLALGLRYTLRRDDIQIPAGIPVSRFILDSLGKTTTSLVGYSLIYDTLDNRLRPTRGLRGVFSQDFAGVGGDIRYLRSRLDVDRYFRLWRGFVLRLGVEGGAIFGLGQDIRINDNFFLGTPRIRGFEVAGLGPRDVVNNDSLGGNVFYVGTAEVKLPIGSAARELGIEASIFADVGSLWDLDLDEEFSDMGDPIIVNPASPRLSVGVGFSWDSPFGPFRIDLSRTVIKEPFDQTEFLQFNVGTVF
ncbi:MAG: outer membrane protein assembly factor BamA [Sphingomonadales bacterium]|nr:outer membrane protein assembly factor BamA [Sphingomonadales bacterium]